MSAEVTDMRSPWAGGFDTDRQREAILTQREESVRLGLWMFLATVMMLFAAFASAYIVRRSGNDWIRIDLPPVLWANTGLLAASTVALEIGAWCGRRRRWLASSACLGITMALGIAFLFGQLDAWRQLLNAQVFVATSPHGSFFYVLTAAHGVHVVAALIVLLWASALTWIGRGRDHRGYRAQALGLARTFWHFLLGVWVGVLALLVM